jgi:SPP1 gp7 family putative phage head morphogenesis protein
MIEGALKADGRLAAKNAVKIRAALRQVTDFKRVFDKYQETQPQPTDNPTQDRVRARSWIMLNVYLNDEPLRQTVMRAWAEAYVLGQVAADEWINKTKEANKADDIAVNWDNWKPGDKATALLLDPTKGFEAYLQSTGGASYFKNFNKETIVNLGTALSDAIALGLDAESAAVMISKHVASPSRALTIAITEQNRAMSFSSIERYKEANLEKIEWAVSDPCDICAKNDGQVIQIGQTFASGDQQPPAHPHCRCVLLPVIPGMEDDPADTAGSITEPPITSEGVVGAEPDYRLLEDIPANKIEDYENFQLRQDPQFSNAGSTPTPEMKKALIDYKQADYRSINSWSRNPNKFKEGLLKRNSIEASNEIMQKTEGLVKEIDAAMEIAPRTKEPFISYRGVSGDELVEFLDQFTLGTVFEDDGFASTTLNFDIARDFTTITGGTGKTRVLRIINPTGSKGIMLDAFWGTQGTESEWLLPRGTKFEVIDRMGSIIDVKVVQQ